MPLAAIASFAGPILGAIGSSDAADAMSNAANSAATNTMAMFNQGMQNTAPWLAGGNSALNAMLFGLGIGGTNPGASSGITRGVFNSAPSTSMINSFLNPNVDYLLGKGENAILNNASALGGVNSGNTMRALTDYAQQGAQSIGWTPAMNNSMALLNNMYNRLSGISGTGANVGFGTAGLGVNAAGTAGNFSTDAASAAAGGIMGVTNSLQGGLNNYLLANSMNNNPNSMSGMFPTPDEMGVLSSNAGFAGAGMYPVM